MLNPGNKSVTAHYNNYNPHRGLVFKVDNDEGTKINPCRYDFL